MKIITLIKIRLWITAVFFLLSSINFVSVKWGNVLNINKISKSALCSELPVLVSADTHDIWHLDMACVLHSSFS